MPQTPVTPMPQSSAPVFAPTAQLAAATDIAINATTMDEVGLSLQASQSSPMEDITSQSSAPVRHLPILTPFQQASVTTIPQPMQVDHVTPMPRSSMTSQQSMTSMPQTSATTTAGMPRSPTPPRKRRKNKQPDFLKSRPVSEPPLVLVQGVSGAARSPSTPAPRRPETRIRERVLTPLPSQTASRAASRAPSSSSSSATPRNAVLACSDTDSPAERIAKLERFQLSLVMPDDQVYYDMLEAQILDARSQIPEATVSDATE